MKEKTFIQLSKNCNRDADELRPYKFAILGDCATQHLATAIKGYAYEAGYQFLLYDADYNQIDAQLLDKQSELYTFAPQSALLYMCTEKLYETFCKTPLQERTRFADFIYQKIYNHWLLINENIKTNILQFTFVDYDDGVFGNFGRKTELSFVYQLQRLNYLLSDGSRSIKNVYLIDLQQIQASLGRQTFHDNKLYYIAKMPISMKALPIVAKYVLDTVNALNGSVKKCVVLDLDNTLWGGVIGDDGMEGIQIGELGIGHAFTEFQNWLKELKNRGILLAVCSKNDETTAKQPFLTHPEMVLHLDDISMFVANWEDKATNIHYIQQTLNIGMDSMVFLDDNPFERELVKSLIPEITVPDLPEDPALYLSYLTGFNLFETASYSAEDRERTDQYRAEAQRVVQQQQFASFDEYLESLQMTATAAPFDPFHYPRIAQLTQRSNQFNLRTIRYTESEIEAIALDNQYITRYFCLKDKFGDHGLISVVILKKHFPDTVFINEWLMSCRVLKRGMEEFIIDKILSVAREYGYKKVIGEYRKTPKNAMVSDIYSRLGFVDSGNGIFEVNVKDYVFHKTYILEASEND